MSIIHVYNIACYITSFISARKMFQNHISRIIKGFTIQNCSVTFFTFSFSIRFPLLLSEYFAQQIQLIIVCGGCLSIKRVSCYEKMWHQRTPTLGYCVQCEVIWTPLIPRGEFSSIYFRSECSTSAYMNNNIHRTL